MSSSRHLRASLSLGMRPSATSSSAAAISSRDTPRSSCVTQQQHSKTTEVARVHFQPAYAMLCWYKPDTGALCCFSCIHRQFDINRALQQVACSGDKPADYVCQQQVASSCQLPGPVMPTSMPICLCSLDLGSSMATISLASLTLMSRLAFRVRRMRTTSRQ